mmetsp:Transcript_59086/g.153604  ORF Transcript_59086/g.153604 Transcript_59086/m.153604 type:complete len:274 (+) Transcript_59086:88-909(+)
MTRLDTTIFSPADSDVVAMLWKQVAQQCRLRTNDAISSRGTRMLLNCKTKWLIQDPDSSTCIFTPRLPSLQGRLTICLTRRDLEAKLKVLTENTATNNKFPDIIRKCSKQVISQLSCFLTADVNVRAKGAPASDVHLGRDPTVCISTALSKASFDRTRTRLRGPIQIPPFLRSAWRRSCRCGSWCDWSCCEIIGGRCGLLHHLITNPICNIFTCRHVFLDLLYLSIGIIDFLCNGCHPIHESTNGLRHGLRGSVELSLNRCGELTNDLPSLLI